MKRRNFLKWSALAFGGAVVACGGLAYVGTRDPDIPFHATSFGADQAAQKILVAYASKCGSTAEVAEALAKTLSEKGARVDVHPVKHVGDIGGYSAVVLGSAIRMGAWLPEAVDFVKKNQAPLSQMPTAFFTVHMLNRDDSAESRKNREAYVAPVHALVTPDAEAFFAGKIELARLSFLDRLISNLMKAKDEDARDWNAIGGWAHSLQMTLASS
jgi:menaquinone-dependent protoporphyrinogen oxidase